MLNVFISWCGKSFALLARIVVDPSLEEAADIRKVAEGLNIPVVEGQTALQAHDLWVGISPDGGWGELAGDTMYACSAEACLIVPRLEAAKVMTDRQLLAAYVAKISPYTVKEHRSEELILRNGRWGMCSGCPGDKNGKYPEKCGETARHDHNIHATKNGKFFSYGDEMPKAMLINTLNT